MSVKYAEHISAFAWRQTGAVRRQLKLAGYCSPFVFHTLLLDLWNKRDLCPPEVTYRFKVLFCFSLSFTIGIRFLSITNTTFFVLKKRNRQIVFVEWLSPICEVTKCTWCEPPWTWMNRTAAVCRLQSLHQLCPRICDKPILNKWLSVCMSYFHGSSSYSI